MVTFMVGIIVPKVGILAVGWWTATWYSDEGTGPGCHLLAVPNVYSVPSQYCCL